MRRRHDLIQSYALWQKITEKTWRKHSAKSWAAPAVLWEATSQKEWKRIYISMLVWHSKLCRYQGLLRPSQSAKYTHLTDRVGSQASWRITQRAELSFLEGHTQPVTCLTASEHTIASGSADKVSPAHMLLCAGNALRDIMRLQATDAQTGHIRQTDLANTAHLSKLSYTSTAQLFIILSCDMVNTASPCEH